MKKFAPMFLAAACGLVLAFNAAAQPPDKKPGDPGKDKPKDTATTSIVERMMAFDKNKDGKLQKDEITDPRLMRLFEQADADKDGVVTKEELEKLATKLEADTPRGPGGRGPGGDGPGGRGPGGDGPGGRGPGGDGPGGRGPGGPGGPPQPGTVLPTFVVDQLKLTEDQKKQLAELQKDVDTRLGKVLTDDQKKQLKEMAERRGPGGPGGREGGPGGGPGGPGGRPGSTPPEKP